MVMLAIAYNHADDSIAERPAPSEVGGYVFDLRETFHKIVAAAGGYYVLIDTDADPHYNATGLQRVQKSGVAFSPLSDSTAAQRAYGPADGAKIAMSPGIQWKEANGPDATWLGLADFAQGQADHVKNVSLEVTRSDNHDVEFAVDWALDGPGEAGRHLVESFTITAAGVVCDDRLVGGSPITGLRTCFPALISDGAIDTNLAIDGRKATITNHGSALTWQIQTLASDMSLGLQGPPVANHSGFVRALIGQVNPAPASQDVQWQITLAQTPIAAP